MKKLMIIAAVALTAVASQAAVFRWSASGVKDITGAAAYSGAATLYAYASTETVADAVAVESVNMTNGAISSHTFTWADATVGTTYYFYYTMTDASKNVFTSGTKGPTMANKSSTGTIPGFSSSGAWVAAPEPTSGLLLLLGVAGLALKRKQK